MKWIAALCFVGLAVLWCVPVASLSGCASRQISTSVVAPALGSSATPIAGWAMVELDAAEAADGVSRSEDRALVYEWADAVRSADAAVIRSEAVPLWPYVRSWAVAGVTRLEDSGRAGPLVADSFRENIAVFAEGLGRVAGPVYNFDVGGSE